MPQVIKNLLLILVVTSLISAGGYGGYLYGAKQGKASGYASGKKAGYDEGYAAAPKPDYLAQNQLQADYNKLVTDYNDLRSAALNYINATQYQARQPITCNSYNYGLNSTSTTCY